MARKVTAALAVALLVSAAAALAADDEQGERDTVEVPPQLFPDQPRELSSITFEPGNSYRLRISGSVDGRGTDGTSYTWTAHHCVAGCQRQGDGSPPGYGALSMWDADTGEPLAPSNLNKKQDTSYTEYPPGGVYEYLLDKFEKRTRIAFSAHPYGQNPSGSGTTHSGKGFTVEILQVGPIVTFKFKQNGIPDNRRHDVLHSQISVTATVRLLDGLSGGRASGPARGSAALVVATADNRDLVSLKLRRAAFHDDEVRRGVAITGIVRSSTIRGCAKGEVGRLTLVDAKAKSADRASLKLCGKRYEWTRGPQNEEFHLSVSKPK